MPEKTVKKPTTKKSPAVAPPPARSSASEAPGLVIGVIGLVMPFLFLSAIGLVLSIISTVQAAKAKSSKVIGIVGVVLNAIGLIITTCFIVALTLAIIAKDNEDTRAAETQNNSFMAKQIAHKAEVFRRVAGVYPMDLRDFEAVPYSSLEDLPVDVTETTPTDSSTFMYRACGQRGAEVAYFDTTTEKVVYRYIGDGSAKTCQK